MRILVTGRNSQLSKSILKIVTQSKQHNEFIYIDKSELDLGDNTNINNYFSNNNFDVIINCAAYTLVDEAENNPELQNQINHVAVKKIADIAKQQNLKLIHISTDYVFDGNSNAPYKETDTPAPINNYGNSKLSGECAIQSLMPNNAIIIRTSWLFSEYGNNFVDTILKLGTNRDNLKVVNDQIGSPTYASDLARAIVTIIYSGEFLKNTFTTNIYHYSNQGQCSRFEFAKAIFSASSIRCDITPITTEKYPTLAKRPMYTVLNKDKIINTFNLDIPNWKESLNNCIELIT